MDQISYFSHFIPCTLLETGAEKYLVVSEEEKGEVWVLFGFSQVHWPSEHRPAQRPWCRLLPFLPLDFYRSQGMQNAWNDLSPSYVLPAPARTCSLHHCVYRHPGALTVANVFKKWPLILLAFIAVIITIWFYLIFKGTSRCTISLWRQDHNQLLKSWVQCGFVWHSSSTFCLTLANPNHSFCFLSPAFSYILRNPHRKAGLEGVSKNYWCRTLPKTRIQDFFFPQQLLTTLELILVYTLWEFYFFSGWLFWKYKKKDKTIAEHLTEIKCCELCEL